MGATDRRRGGTFLMKRPVKSKKPRDYYSSDRILSEEFLEEDLESLLQEERDLIDRIKNGNGPRVYD